MSNNAINHNIKLTVKDGLPYISMNFNGMDVSSLRGYLKNLSYYKTGFEFDKYGNPVGDLADVTIDSYQQFSDGSMFEDACCKIQVTSFRCRIQHVSGQSDKDSSLFPNSQKQAHGLDSPTWNFSKVSNTRFSAIPLRIVK